MKAKSKKAKVKKGKKHMWTGHPKKPATLEPVEAPLPPKPEAPAVKKEVPNMADNNYDPQLVGGRQPIYCPQCSQEVKPQDSYHLSLDNKRYHYPICWQQKELGMSPVTPSRA